MRKKGRNLQPEIAGDMVNPRGFGRWIKLYLEYLAQRNYAEHTRISRRVYLNLFTRWAEERGLRTVGEVTRPIVDRYQKHLFNYRQKSGKPLSFRSQHHHLMGIKGFFTWLSKERVILYNPAGEIELPRINKRLPHDILTIGEVETMLEQADLDKPQGLRDRAAMEMLYSTGIRRSELCALRLEDIDEERGVLYVRKGKGGQDRYVPIGARALRWVTRYRDEARPKLMVDQRERTLYLTKYGEPIGGDVLSQHVARYIEKTQSGKKGSCHLLRHTMATHMLEGGADVRIIQAILGHRNLETTEIYTQVSIKHLKEVHERTHPAQDAARLRDEPAKKPAEEAALAALGEAEEGAELGAGARLEEADEEAV